MRVTECRAAGCRTEIADSRNSFLCSACWQRLPSPVVAEFTYRRMADRATTDLRPIALAALADQGDPTE